MISCFKTVSKSKGCAFLFLSSIEFHKARYNFHFDDVYVDVVSYPCTYYVISQSVLPYIYLILVIHYAIKQYILQGKAHRLLLE